MEPPDPAHPAYFDLQVNGYAGVDFNADDLSADELHGACAKLREDGVAGILATVITDAPARMERRLARIAELRDADPLARETIAGVHVEGPFLSSVPAYAGAHPVEHTRDADVDAAARLLDAARGLVRLVTLAPERDPGAAAVGFLVARDVRVAAGHTDASRDQLAAAIDAGLSIFTHLGNGCPLELPRHDNIVQRALSLSEHLWCCFIADGIHVPLFALRNYLRCATAERSALVTDAIAAAGLGPGRYSLAGRPVRVGADGAVRAEHGEHLVGSSATMPRIAGLLRRELGLSEPEIARLLRDNPRRALGLDAAEGA